jgi:hypothetical protein
MSEATTEACEPVEPEAPQETLTVARRSPDQIWNSALRPLTDARTKRTHF